MDEYLIAREYYSAEGQYFGTLYFRDESSAERARELSNKKKDVFRRWFEFLQFLVDQELDFKVSM